MIKNFDTKSLDAILDKMIMTVEDSKDEIFRIGEQCRKDYASLADELEAIKEKVKQVIKEEEELEIKSRFARKRLAEVSLHFRNYSEYEVRTVYEQAHALQMELLMKRREEKQLRTRRDELERRLQGLMETIEKADRLVSQTTVVLKYLSSDLKQVGELLEDAKLKQEFGLKIIEAQEEERKRLSREIHDGPAQMLANVMMRSDLIERTFKEYGEEAAIAEIKSLKKMVRDALYEVRRIIYDLRPMALDDLGLVPTLKKYLNTMEDYFTRPKITYICVGEARRLPSKYEVALFRLIQESVQNAIKHADANEIKVKLEFRKNDITVLVKDDGKGFDVNERKSKSFGLIGMRERVELLNGQMSIDSTIGKGTVVLIQVPLED